MAASTSSSSSTQQPASDCWEEEGPVVRLTTLARGTSSPMLDIDHDDEDGSSNSSKPFVAGEDGTNQSTSQSTAAGEIELGMGAVKSLSSSKKWGVMWGQIEMESSRNTMDQSEAQAGSRPLVQHIMESSESFDFERGTGEQEDEDENEDWNENKTNARFPSIRRQHARDSIWKFEEYELPESTYTLLMTSDVFSFAFFVGILAASLSIASLAIVLYNVTSNDTLYSDMGIPGGVKPAVLAAQYLGKLLCCKVFISNQFRHNVFVLNDGIAVQTHTFRTIGVIVGVLMEEVCT